MPVLLPFGGADDWFHPPRPGLLGLNPAFNGIGELLGRWAASARHRHIVVLHPDYPPISPLMAAVAVRSFERASDGGTVAQVSVPLGSTDGSTMADAIVAAAEAIIVLTNWPELLALTTELRRRGKQLPLYSWSANVDQDIAAKLGDLIEGMYGYSPLLVGPLADTTPVRRYRAAMAREFPGRQPDFMSMHAFAQTEIFIAALSRVRGPLTQPALLEAFYSLQDFHTDLLPPVTFAPHRHMGIDQVQPMQLQGSVWTSVGPPQSLPPTCST
jgi:hypothetical protein